MTVVTLKKEAVLSLGHFIEEDILNVCFFGKAGDEFITISVQFRVIEETLSGFDVRKGTFRVNTEKVNETISCEISTLAKETIQFIVAATKVSDVKLKMTSSKNKVTFLSGSIVFNVNCEYSVLSNPFSVDRMLSVISFTKEDFDKEITNKVFGLSNSMCWFNNKSAGTNIIVNAQAASIVIGTKSFFMKSSIKKATIYTENLTGGFVYNEGVIFLKDDFIKMISEEAKAEEEIYFSAFPIEEDINDFNISVVIGESRCIYSIATIVRKNVLTNNQNQIIPFLEEESSNSAAVNRNEFKAFFDVFKDNSLFLEETIFLNFDAIKSILSIKLCDDETNTSLFELSKCRILADFSITLNFYVLSSVISNMVGEEIYFKEKASNAKRIVISDAESDFIVGKIVK